MEKLATIYPTKIKIDLESTLEESAPSIAIIRNRGRSTKSRTERAAKSNIVVVNQVIGEKFVSQSS